jgi:hypothetical protein
MISVASPASRHCRAKTAAACASKGPGLSLRAATNSLKDCAVAVGSSAEKTFSVCAVMSLIVSPSEHVT